MSQAVLSLPTTETLAPGLGRYQEGTATVLVLSEDMQDLPSLKTVEDEHVVLLIPQGWLTQRARKDLSWTVPNPKTKQEVTLYSTTFFYHPVNQLGEEVLALALEKEWVIYSVGTDQVCLLVLDSQIAVDVDPDKLYHQLKG